MEKHNLITLAHNLAGRFQAISYDDLPISDYNKRYIRTICPALEYYMEIYADCLWKGIQSTGKLPSEITLIDYGGGSGFLSLLAKEAGFGQVVYIDLNPLSVETIKILKQHTGAGPDIILPGDSNALAAWCTARHIKPDLLIATDLIEHVYNLPCFFADLGSINADMQMIFTTASTPYNPIIKRRLHRFMTDCESGRLFTPNYYTRRELFIREHYPHLSDEQVKVWSECTRGLIYEDIKKAIDNNHLPLPDGKYNTCDPETGNWAERILPIHQYETLIAPYGYSLLLGKGFYNTHRKNGLTKLISKFLNVIIRNTGRLGLYFAPFIILYCKK